MRLYLKFFAIHVKTEMAYRASFFLSILGRLLMLVEILLGLVFLMGRFDTIGGYTLPEILVGYAVVLTGFSLAEGLARGFDAFSKILREAAFDRIMVRPRGVIFQVICQDLRLESLINVFYAMAVLAYAVARSDIAWTPVKILVLLAMMLCSALLFFGIFMAYAALCFVTLEGLEVMNIFTDGVREYSKYPFHIYGKGVLMILTFIFPMALVQYWPMQYLMGTGPGWYGILPLVSLLFLLPCYGLWRLGLRRYTSTGS